MFGSCSVMCGLAVCGVLAMFGSRFWLRVSVIFGLCVGICVVCVWLIARNGRVVFWLRVDYVWVYGWVIFMFVLCLVMVGNLWVTFGCC